MNKRKIIDIIFLIIEIVLYYLIFNGPSRYNELFSYLSIILVFIYGLTFSSAIRNKRVALMILGLFTTIIADYFLVLLGMHKELAMLSFSITQMAYALVILESSKNARAEIITRICGSALVLLITFAVLKESCNTLSLISMFYYFNLVMNIIMSFINHCSTYLKVGLILFICCDTIIGVQNLDGYFTIANDSFINSIIHPGFNLPWIFYLPSQVLIGYSIKSFVKEPSKISQENVINEFTI